MSISIAIAGVSGRMGQALARAADRTASIAGGSVRRGSAHEGADIGSLVGRTPMGMRATSDPALAAGSADIWIDFTTPDATLAALSALEATPVRAAVIGTTGFSPRDEADIVRHARRIAIVKAGNFALGVNLLCALVEQAAARLGADWDIEISETHHRRKVDAPSGTALMLGHAAAQGRGERLDALRLPPHDGMTGPRTEGAIGFSVRRAGGVFGEHAVLFASEEEKLELSHMSLNRDVFARGALHAAMWVADRPPGLYSMRDVLAL